MGGTATYLSVMTPENGPVLARGRDMHEVLAFLILHGYIALMLWVFVEQIGVPLPAAPVLLAAGALAGTGLLNGWVSAGTALMAALVSDLIWFQIGRVRGNTVLGLLCRISLEPPPAPAARRTCFPGMARLRCCSRNSFPG